MQKNIKKYIHDKSNIKFFLLNYDVGFLNLKQALKTLFAVLITAVIVYYIVAPPAAILSGFVAGFSSKCIRNGKKSEQFSDLLLACLSFEVMIIFTLFFYHSFWELNIIFVLLCFPAFYVRKFGARYLVFPALSLVLFQITAALPLRLGVLDYCVPVLVAFVVTTLIQLYIFNTVIIPGIREGLLFFNRKYFTLIKNFASGIKDKKNAWFYKELLERDQNLEHIFQSIQTLLENHRSEHLIHDKVNRFIHNQYAFIKLLSLLFEDMTHLAGNKMGENISRAFHLIMVDICYILYAMTKKKNKQSRIEMRFSLLERKIESFTKIGFNINYSSNDNSVIYKPNENNNVSFTDIDYSNDDNSIIYMSNICFAVTRFLALLKEQNKLFQIDKQK